MEDIINPQSGEIRDTGITVKDVLEELAGASDVNGVLNRCPSLTREDIAVALRFAAMTTSKYLNTAASTPETRGVEYDDGPHSGGSGPVGSSTYYNRDRYSGGGDGCNWFRDI